MLQLQNKKHSYLVFAFTSCIGMAFPTDGAAKIIQLTNFSSDCTDIRSISLNADGSNVFFISKCDLTNNNQSKVDQIFKINISNNKISQVTRLKGNQISSAMASGDGSTILNLQWTGTSQLLYATASDGLKNILIKKIDADSTYDRIQDYLSIDFYGQKIVYAYSRFSGWGCSVPSIFIADTKTKEQKNIYESNWCNFPVYIPEISGNGNRILVRENWWSNGPFDLVSINTSNGDISPIVKDAASNFEVMSADLSLSGATTVFSVGDYLGIFGFEPPFSLYKSLVVGGKKYKLNPCKPIHDTYSCMASPSLISADGKSIISRLHWDSPWGCSSCDYYPDTLVRFHGNGDQVEIIASADDRKFFINLEAANKDNSIIIFSTNKNLVGNNESNISQLYAYIDDNFFSKIPVVLIHGFTGDRTSFGRLEEFLEITDGLSVFAFDYSRHTTVNPFNKENWSIERIAGELGKYICVTVKGGKLNRSNGSCSDTRPVDIVAHSMGGLVSRAYMAGMANIGQNTAGDLINLPYHQTNSIRKFVMAGTPNYGASPATWAEWFYMPLIDVSNHVQAKELIYGSSFIWNLHWAWQSKLNKEILPDETSILAIVGTKNTVAKNGDDGVVNIASAVLPDNFLSKAQIRYVPYKHSLVYVATTSNLTYKLINTFLNSKEVPILYNPPIETTQKGLLLFQFSPSLPDCISIDNKNYYFSYNEDISTATIFPLTDGSHSVGLFAPDGYHYEGVNPFDIYITGARPNVVAPILFKVGDDGINCHP